MVNEVFTSVTGTQSDDKISWTCEGNVALHAKRLIPRIVGILRKLRFNFGIFAKETIGLRLTVECLHQLMASLRDIRGLYA